jgi:hypothetical protein
VLGRRRSIVIGAVVVGTAFGVVAVGLRSGGGDGPDVRAGSELIDPDARTLLDGAEPPGAYRIDYRVEGYGGGEAVVTSDRLWVRRPFDSRLEVYDADTPGGEPDAVQVASFGAVRAEGAERTTVVVASPPGAPASDVRVGTALADAVRERRAEVVEHRQVLGRPCHVIRTAELLATSDLSPVREHGEHADTCIDAHGMVLEELLVSGGEPLLRRVAIDLELDPDLAGVSFDPGEPTVPVDDGGGFVGEVEPDSRLPGRFFESTAPAGSVHRGRYAVVPPQADNFTDPSRIAQRLTYVSDVFVVGADVVVLDQGGTYGDVDPFPGLRGVEVDLGDLGAGILTFGAGGPVVVVDLGEGDFVRARGTVAPGPLLELLRTLEEGEGGELRLRDGAQRGGG